MLEDRRVARLRAAADRPRRLPHTRAVAVETARLDARVEATLAARSAATRGASGKAAASLPAIVPYVLRQMCEDVVQWDAYTCGAVRLTCSAWCELFDSALPSRLQPRGWEPVMEGKLGWFEGVVELDLRRCEPNDAFSGRLAQLRSMPSLRRLSLASRHAEKAVDAEALCALTALTDLELSTVLAIPAPPASVGRWLLDLGRLTALTRLSLNHSYQLTDEALRAVSGLQSLSILELRCCTKVTDEGMRSVGSVSTLTSLDLFGCAKTTDAGVRAVSCIAALRSLDLGFCWNVTNAALRAVSSLPALASLKLHCCSLVTDEGLRAVSELQALTVLDLLGNRNLTDEALRSVSRLPSLTTLSLHSCRQVTDEGVRALSSLTALTWLNLSFCNLTDRGLEALRSENLSALAHLHLRSCRNITAAGKQSLRNNSLILTIHD